MLFVCTVGDEFYVERMQINVPFSLQHLKYTEEQMTDSPVWYSSNLHLIEHNKKIKVC